MRILISNWLARRLHQLFEASLLIKGFFALCEMASGLVLLGVGLPALARFVDWLTRNALVEDRSAPMAVAASRLWHGFTPESAHFYAIYLAAHGVIKLLMVLMLARRALWAYPASMVVLAGFVGYQLFRYSHEPSLGLLVLSALDFIMIGLVWREYCVLKAAPPLPVACPQPPPA